MNEQELNRDEKFGEPQKAVEIAIGDEPRHRRGSIAQYFVPWALVWAVITHAIVGTALFLDPEGVSGISVLVGLDAFLAFGVPVHLFAVLLLCASALAALGLRLEGGNHPSRRVLLALLLPQYFLVTVGLVSDTLILIDGEFRGRPFDFWVGLVGLGPVLVISLLHNISIVERYFLKWAYRR